MPPVVKHPLEALVRLIAKKKAYAFATPSKPQFLISGIKNNKAIAVPFVI